MRILVTGASGRLGSQLVNLLSPHHEVIPATRREMDIGDYAATQRYILAQAPELVLHCAAMTTVDECALRPDDALRINGLGTKAIALACQQLDAAMLYISSNEVFDGRNTGFVQEYDPTCPVNPYGYSKWVGEQVIRDHLTKFYIVRTSWIFAHGGRNFVHVVLSRAKENQPLRVVINEVGVPTYNNDLAEAVTALIGTQQYGIYHLVNEGRASRWTFARQILDLAGYSDTPIEKIALAEFSRPSTPPEYSVLKNTMAAALGIKLRPWEDAVAAYLQQEGLLA